MVSFSMAICAGSNGDEGRIAQSTLPSASTETFIFGRTSRMSKIRNSPRMKGASSASMENSSTVIAGSPLGPPPTVTSAKVTDGNGRMRAVASPLTVTLRPRIALASRSNSVR